MAFKARWVIDAVYPDGLQIQRRCARTDMARNIPLANSSSMLESRAREDADLRQHAQLCLISSEGDSEADPFRVVKVGIVSMFAGLSEVVRRLSVYGRDNLVVAAQTSS